MAQEKVALDFTKDEKMAILEWCRELLRATLEDKPEPEGPELKGNGGVFVTLKKDGDLRGCIGVFDWSRPVKETIARMTKAAAFADHRFNAVSLPEVDQLEIVVSVLTQPEKLEGIDKIVIGRDGLYLVHPKGRGVLLPSVAVEYGFAPLEFVENTCRKAGLPPSAYADPGAELMVFRAPAFSSQDFA
ncbi:MAG: AmmeMemoRadiSam system protein A [Deltaproteobacteria bacterium]|jgi:AmmeMemoRadiSam system protein A|nr:AmmeMemoRadiSam system protein A [Deltaproteobacteria bacterium]